MVHGFELPGLPGSRALTSMLSVSQQQNGHGTSRLGVSSQTDSQADSTSANDVALFGINLKAGGHQHHMSSLIEKR